MKLIKDVRMEALPYHTNIVIPCERGQNKAIERLLAEINTIDPQKDYDISVKPKKRRRSLTANAYLWQLLGNLSDKLSVKGAPKSKEDIYREMIRDYGVYEIISLPTAAVKRYADIWQSKGEGNLCEVITPGEDKTELACYYGSSTYDTKEMSRLIDAVVTECKEQGIETLPPNELARLKSMWGGS